MWACTCMRSSSVCACRARRSSMPVTRPTSAPRSIHPSPATSPDPNPAISCAAPAAGPVAPGGLAVLHAASCGAPLLPTGVVDREQPCAACARALTKADSPAGFCGLLTSPGAAGAEQRQAAPAAAPAPAHAAALAAGAAACAKCPQGLFLLPLGGRSVTPDTDPDPNPAARQASAAQASTSASAGTGALFATASGFGVFSLSDAAASAAAAWAAACAAAPACGTTHTSDWGPSWRGCPATSALCVASGSSRQGVNESGM